MSTIYVSSTFIDLRDHRKAVSMAIRRLGHVDLAMEYYVAEHARPLDRCLRDAGSCDLYLGLFARRYGFCPAGHDRSITELELRAAQAAEVDSLCFLLADDAAWPGEYVEQGPGAEKLAALRAEISDRYLSGFFSTPNELAAIASASIVRNLELGRTPFDAMREHRLMKSWRSATALPAERVRAGQALVNMGSPRYLAEVKERLLAADAHSDVASKAEYLVAVQRMATSRRELMPIFLDLLEHDDCDTRYFAVFHLGELALRDVDLAPMVLEQLVKRCKDSSVNIRAQLAHALGKLTLSNRSRPDVTMALERLRRDEAQEVRDQAEISLRQSR